MDTQFHALCRILTDQSQPMNNKVKQAWLEYMHELIPLMDSEDFKDNSGERQSGEESSSILIQFVHVHNLLCQHLLYVYTS